MRAAKDAAPQAHLYPDSDGEALTEAVARHVGIDACQVAVGSGSLALLERLLLAYTGPGAEVIHAWRSYEAYPILTSVAGAISVPIPLDASYTHDVNAMIAAVTARTRVVIVCNPNNPTGTALPAAELERLVESVPSTVLVVIDEAYREFDQHAPATLRLVARHPNVALLRTFSKAYALAGLRAGYLIASERTVSTVRRAALPFGVNRLASAAAIAALSDSDHLNLVVNTAQAARRRLQNALKGMISLPESTANFLWLPLKDGEARLSAECARYGFSIRVFPGEGVRVTVGHPEIEPFLVGALRRI